MALVNIAKLTEKDILKGLKLYFQQINSDPRITWGGGDSIDRERVRDIILRWRKWASNIRGPRARLTARRAR